MTEDPGTSMSTRRPAPMIVKTFTPENGAKVFVIMENLPGECRHCNRHRGRGQRYGSAMTKRPQVTVLGSLNMDISVTVPRLPGPGATALGSAARFTAGGKGANQAVAAARLGAAVRMVGCVGGDEFGDRITAALRAEDIGLASVRAVP